MNKSKPFTKKHIHSINLDDFSTGTIFKKTTGFFSIHSHNKTFVCTLSAHFHKISEADLAVGDEVYYLDLGNGSGQIMERMPRRSKLARRSAVPMPTATPHEQVIVANVDQVVPVFAAANPEPKWNMLDRYLVSAESAGLGALICITKLDLAQKQAGGIQNDLQAAVDEYRKIGYPVILVSAHTGQGIEEARTALVGRISVFLGKSGVGKTSLLNALQPGLGQRVNQVNEITGKGRHTTTHFEMFPLEWTSQIASGGAIVDTPGVREFGLWDVAEDDLALFFPEMRPFVGRCRFRLDCRHDEEPGCAVRKAVMSGLISPLRYQSYMRLKEDSSFV